ncbi:putative cytochrome P450 [Helianthus debilis subsp. tardiflorus]
MADKFGPIFTFKLGVNRVLVVSNSEMAKECLTTNDRGFATRPKAMVSELMGYNYASFSLAPYGPYWRHIRKIIVLEMASHRHLQMLEHIRVSEVNSSLIDIYKTRVTNKGSSETVMVDMIQWFGNLVTNIVVRMMFGNHFSPGE